MKRVVVFRKDGMCICDGASLSDRQAMLVRISVCAIVEAGTVALFGYVLILSRSEADGLGINTAKYSLSQRFQVVVFFTEFISMVLFYLIYTHKIHTCQIVHFSALKFLNSFKQNKSFANF